MARLEENEKGREKGERWRERGREIGEAEGRRGEEEEEGETARERKKESLNFVLVFFPSEGKKGREGDCMC